MIKAFNVAFDALNSNGGGQSGCIPGISGVVDVGGEFLFPAFFCELYERGLEEEP